MGEDHPSRFEEKYSTDDVLDVFEEVPGPTIIVADVKDELGCSRGTARNKLHELHDQGRVEMREKGRVSLWWLAEEGDAIAEEQLKRLSVALGTPITVGDVVYEDGDKHPLSSDEEVENDG